MGSISIFHICIDIELSGINRSIFINLFQIIFYIIFRKFCKGDRHQLVLIINRDTHGISLGNCIPIFVLFGAP